jgi:hypothetical protein
MLFQGLLSTSNSLPRHFDWGSGWDSLNLTHRFRLAFFWGSPLFLVWLLKRWVFPFGLTVVASLSPWLFDVPALRSSVNRQQTNNL